jgi:polyisoprenoid-binding protein YceI
VSQTQLRSAHQPVRQLLVPAATLALGAAFLVGVGAANAQDDAAADGIDGTWAIDTSIGSLEEGTSTYVGFRVAEVLDPGGEKVAVGRTPDINGQLDVEGSVIENFHIVADLTTLTTDKDFRNRAIQRTLGTGQFPTAEFVSTEPVDLGTVPVDGEPFSISVPGTLTIKGASQDITVDLEGGRGGDSVVVVGSWPIDFGEFGISMPSAPIVVSVEDNGDLEWQLFFTREADTADGEDVADDEDMAEDEMTEEEMTEDDASEE